MDASDVVIRAEQPRDQAGIRAVNTAAFPTALEADIVDALRKQAAPFLSLVAVAGDQVIGHILFTPVGVGAAPPSHRVMGLAPMAVAPQWQRQGLGGALVRAGLRACRNLDTGIVVVLGHPDYYPRFGFRSAGEFGLQFPAPGADSCFFALRLGGDAPGPTGTVAYHPAFAADTTPWEGNEP